MRGNGPCGLIYGRLVNATPSSRGNEASRRVATNSKRAIPNGARPIAIREGRNTDTGVTYPRNARACLRICQAASGLVESDGTSSRNSAMESSASPASGSQ